MMLVGASDKKSLEMSNDIIQEVFTPIPKSIESMLKLLIYCDDRVHFTQSTCWADFDEWLQDR